MLLRPARRRKAGKSGSPYHPDKKAAERTLSIMKNQEEICCTHDCCLKHKHREDKEYRDLINRLSRIEGQIRGIRAMVEEERYCIDIITQVSAVSSALNAFNKALLSQHIKTCVADNIRKGNDEVIDELCETLKKLMK